MAGVQSKDAGKWMTHVLATCQHWWLRELDALLHQPVMLLVDIINPQMMLGRENWPSAQPNRRLLKAQISRTYHHYLLYTHAQASVGLT